MITAGLFYKFRGNFFKFSKNDEIQIKPFCFLLLFTFNALPAQKNLNIKKKNCSDCNAFNDRINQLKKNLRVKMSFGVIVEDDYII